MNRKVICGKRFGEERALYAAKDVTVQGCRFLGVEDGESVLKETRNVNVQGSTFNLRYPLWHAENLLVQNCFFLENSRAPFWYDKNVNITQSKFRVIKALRECESVKIETSQIESDEFGWKCKDVHLYQSSLKGEYAFFDSENIHLKDVTFAGKYSFQYVNDLTIDHCKLHTKDAFWHSKNVTVKDSEVFGEYLGWFSENLTLIRCRIKGTQPLCYCKRLTLINCTMEDCDLAFEYSDVEAKVLGTIPSIKNPGKGHIYVGKVGEVIRSEAVHPADGKVIEDASLNKITTK